VYAAAAVEDPPSLADLYATTDVADWAPQGYQPTAAMSAALSGLRYFVMLNQPVEAGKPADYPGQWGSDISPQHPQQARLAPAHGDLQSAFQRHTSRCRMGRQSHQECQHSPSLGIRVPARRPRCKPVRQLTPSERGALRQVSGRESRPRSIAHGSAAASHTSSSSEIGNRRRPNGSIKWWCQRQFNDGESRR
jgi:hypothetical protein